MKHRNICIRFEIDGNRFEAVGFLNKGEKYVSTSEAHRRAIVRGTEDIEWDDLPFFLNRAKLPAKLQQVGWFVSCWDEVDDEWGADALFLRRRTYPQLVPSHLGG